MTEVSLQKLLKEYHVPAHIVAHMKKVAAVSLFLANRIRKNSGEGIDLATLRQAALLHDILKLGEFKALNLHYFQQPPNPDEVAFWTHRLKSYPQQEHCKAAYELLSQKGEPVIATIIKKHRFSCLIEKQEQPSTWEEKILYYADKRVKHNQIVSIQERLEDGRKRYFPDGKIPAKDHEIEKALLKLELELCQKAQMKPGDINEKNVIEYLA